MISNVDTIIIKKKKKKDNFSQLILLLELTLPNAMFSASLTQ